MRSCRVLYVNYDFPPISGPGTWRALSFTNHLSRAGYHVTVLCADRSYWCDRYSPALVHEIDAGVRVIRLHSPLVADLFRWLHARCSRLGLWRLRPALDTLSRVTAAYYPDPVLLWFVAATWRALREARAEPYDCIITSGPPHLVHVVGWIARAGSDSAWIMDLRDLWTDDASQSPQHGVRARVMRWLESRTTAHADAVVTVSPTWQRSLRAKRPSHEREKVHMIRNGHDFDGPRTLRAAPAPATDAGAREAPLHVHFNGTPQPHSTAPSFFEALGTLRDASDADARAPLVTFTGFDATLREAVEARGLHGIVTDVGVMTHQDSVAYSARCDVLLVLVNNENAARPGTIPAKTYEMMALGRHILAIVPAASDVAALLAPLPGTTVCDVDRPHDIAAALRTLARSKREGRLNPPDQASAVIAASRAYTRAAQAEQLIALLESLRSRPAVRPP